MNVLPALQEITKPFSCPCRYKIQKNVNLTVMVISILFDIFLSPTCCDRETAIIARLWYTTSIEDAIYVSATHASGTYNCYPRVQISFFQNVFRMKTFLLIPVRLILQGSSSLNRRCDNCDQRLSRQSLQIIHHHHMRLNVMRATFHLSQGSTQPP